MSRINFELKDKSKIDLNVIQLISIIKLMNKLQIILLIIYTDLIFQTNYQISPSIVLQALKEEQKYMSHFIQNTKNIQNQPIFSFATKQIVMPKIKKYIKVKKDQQNINFRKQSKLLNNICQRLQKQQFEEIHNQNVRQMQKKFQKLKKRMHHNMQKQSVQNILNCQIDTQKLNIREIVKMRPERIQLQKKYGNHILLRMQNFREAQQIDKMKQNYKNWYDSQKNDRCNSPIFKKMAYLLERANRQNILSQLPFYKNKQNQKLERQNQRNTNQSYSKNIQIFVKNKPAITYHKHRNLVRHTTKQIKQLTDNSFEITIGSIKNTSPYKKRQLNWSNKKQKFSILNHNFQF